MTRLAAALALLLLAACGAPSAPGPPGVSQPPSLKGAITEQQDGGAVSVALHQTVDVALTEQPGFGPWENVDSGDHAILAPTVNVGATAVRGVTLRSYKAESLGTTQITATAAPLCSPGQACPQLVRVFKVTVEVV
jgi:hypothetical protein